MRNVTCLINLQRNLDNRKARIRVNALYNFPRRIKRKEISSRTLYNHIKAIKLLHNKCYIVNWDKIKMGMSTLNQILKNKIPEILEINPLFGYHDIKNNAHSFNNIFIRY